MVKKRFNGIEMFFVVGKFRDLAPQGGNKPRLCSIHSESVSVYHADYPDLSNAPEESIVSHLPSVEFSGCCYEAIDSEINFIKSTVREHEERSFNDN